jgi:chromosome segregation ATPase
MNIPTIYILFSAEVLLILTGLIVFLFFYIRKLSSIPVLEETASPTVDISNSYIDFLEQELSRNDNKSMEVETDEMEAASDNEESSESESENDNTESEKTLEQSKLIEIRNILLNTEKSAAEQDEDEGEFWKAIYSGMQEISEHLKPEKNNDEVEEKTEEMEEIEEVEEENTEDDHERPESDEDKVLYIEVQGKKIDSEVNKLKDIIFDQENTVNGLKKALENTEKSQPDGSSLDDNEDFQELKQQANAFEQQISDSKMCMDVLEMENNRLQTEVDDLQGRYDELFKKEAEVETEVSDEDKTDEQPSNENIDQIKDALDKQEQQIVELNSTIDGLQLEAGEAAALKDKLSEFARNRQEMMGCIAILEDENAFLQNMVTELEEKTEDKDSVDEEEASTTEAAPESDGAIRMREELEKQEEQIAALNKTIDDLQLTAEQAEKLKSTIAEFTRSSQEMMSCITILEEENKNLQNIITEIESQPAAEIAPPAEAAPSATDEKFDKLKTKVKKYEKEIIKKDVAYAKLQDEFSTMEKEMQALYAQSGDA